MFLKNKLFISFSLCFILSTNLFSNEESLFVSQDNVRINNNSKIDDSVLRESQDEFNNILNSSELNQDNINFKNHI